MDVLDAMVDEKDLTPSFKLPLDSVSDDFLVITGHESPDREAIFRGSLDEAEVPNSGDSHLECPRNGSRREGDHIHEFPHLLQFLLMGDAKSMLLINDQQSQISERDVFLQKPVCPDDNVHLAFLHPLKDLLLLPGTFEPA